MVYKFVSFVLKRCFGELYIYKRILKKKLSEFPQKY